MAYMVPAVRKNAALEAERAAQNAMPLSEPQPQHSARNTKSHRKAKLKAITEDLLSRFLAIPEGG